MRRGGGATSSARRPTFEGEPEFAELGFHIEVLQPGQPNCMYHGESDQEDFLVVSGECIIVLDGEERHLRAWDFVHCPPMAEHVFVGAGDGPCVIVMTGRRKGGGEILYPVNDVAAKHGASVREETPEPEGGLRALPTAGADAIPGRMAAVSDDTAFVVNARDVMWRGREGHGRSANLEGDAEFEELGFQLVVLDPGVPACMYHGERAQEDFLVVSGECVLVIEGEERHLKQWDFVHCPPMTEHVFVGAGDGPCAIVMVGAQSLEGARGGDHLPRERRCREVRRERARDDTRPGGGLRALHGEEPAPYREGDLPDSADGLRGEARAAARRPRRGRGGLVRSQRSRGTLVGAARARPLGDLEGDGDFEQLGIRIAVLQPGEPSSMYHGETGQENFLVVSGECVLVIEGEERRLKAWDFVHCPPLTGHTFVGAGEGPCVDRHGRRADGDDKILYPVNDVAARHGASVETETPEPKEAYAPYPREPLFMPYREGDLPVRGSRSRRGPSGA